MLIMLLYYRTLRFLKPIQIYFRIYYYIRNRLNKPKLTLISKENDDHCTFLFFIPAIVKHEFFQSGVFTFLNMTSTIPTLHLQEKNQQEGDISPHFHLKRKITVLDWDFCGFGKLWTYNLNYFEYLHQSSMTKEQGLELIFDFIRKSESHVTGIEPYPTSLRINNWIKFICRHKIDEPAIIASLYLQCKMLTNNIEYHLLGNHILENGFALFSAGLFLKEPFFYNKGKKILVSQLNEQILPDGGHFELSPMYHAIMLSRVLDSINILQQNPQANQELLPFLTQKATLMISWIRAMTFSSGDIPLFNDAARNIAPDSKQLLDYAERLGIYPHNPGENALWASGYKKVSMGIYEMFIDAGAIGPDYIPGHAHADMLNFELQVDGNPFIVDTGTSTYLPGAVRSFERSTSAHNTVTIGERDQSEMWGSHRVGRRADCRVLTDFPGEFCAAVKGFSPLNAIHERTFRFQDDQIEIFDSIRKNRNHKGVAYFHFFPGISIDVSGDLVMTNCGMLYFESHESIEVGEFNYAPEFNKTISSKMIKVSFLNNLKTKILLHH